jgi:hypothetical protein
MCGASDTDGAGGLRVSAGGLKMAGGCFYNDDFVGIGRGEPFPRQFRASFHAIIPVRALVLACSRIFLSFHNKRDIQ